MIEKMKSKNTKAEAAPAQAGTNYPLGKFFPVRLNGKIFVAVKVPGFEGSLQVAEIVQWKSKVCTETHTNLLCAAPALLAALKAIVDGGNSDCGSYWKVDVDDINQARAAIAQAEKGAA